MTIPQFNEAANEYMGSTLDLTFSHLLIIACVSVWQAAVSTLFSVAVALIIVHYGSASRALQLCMAYLAPFCSVLPSWLAVVSIEYAYHLEGLYAIIVAHMMLNIPLCWYVLNDVYQNFDAETYMTACGLGATSWYAYRSIVIPQVKDSVRSLGLLVFILCFSSITIPKYAAMYYYHHTINSALSVACDLHEYHIAACAWLVRIASIICLLYFCGMKRVSVPRSHYCVIAFTPTRERKSSLGFISALLLAGFFLVIPLIALFFLCMAHYTVSAGELLCKAAVASLTVSCMSSTLAVLIASICLALTIMCSPTWLCVIEFVALLPFMLGNVAVGMCCNVMGNGYAALVVSHAMLNYPLAYACMRAYMQQFSYEWVYQARSMGASYATILHTIVAPHAYAACMRAWTVASCMSLTEVGAAHVMKQRGFITLAMLLREYRIGSDMGGVMRISVLVLICTVIVASIPQAIRFMVRVLLQAVLAAKRLLPLPFQILYRFRQGV